MNVPSFHLQTSKGSASSGILVSNCESLSMYGLPLSRADRVERSALVSKSVRVVRTLHSLNRDEFPKNSSPFIQLLSSQSEEGSIAMKSLCHQ